MAPPKNMDKKMEDKKEKQPIEVVYRVSFRDYEKKKDAHIVELYVEEEIKKRYLNEKNENYFIKSPEIDYFFATKEAAERFIADKFYPTDQKIIKVSVVDKVANMRNMFVPVKEAIKLLEIKDLLKMKDVVKMFRKDSYELYFLEKEEVQAFLDIISLRSQIWS